MKFTLPPGRFVGKAFTIALLLGGVALLFASTGFGPTSAAPLFVPGIFITALLAAWLAGVGEEGAHHPAEAKSVFVGNLAFKARPEELRDLFSRYGSVHSVRIMTDRATRRPRGFAFVEMDAPDAKRAIGALDGQEFLGRKLRVSEGSENRRSGTGREAA